jgi:hypothetical protein
VVPETKQAHSGLKVRPMIGQLCIGLRDHSLADDSPLVSKQLGRRILKHPHKRRGINSKREFFEVGLTMNRRFVTRTHL